MPAGSRQPATHAQPAKSKCLRNRGVYVILGLISGELGFHNFYAGLFLRGAMQYLLSSIATGLLLWDLFKAPERFSDFLGMALILWALIGIWVLCDLLTTTHDGQGDPMT